MIRFALYLVLGYIFFKLLKTLFSTLGSGSRQQSEKPSYKDGTRQINEMVQDPVCKVYVPKKEALHLDLAGKSYYFCSRMCMDKFQKHDG